MPRSGSLNSPVLSLDNGHEEVPKEMSPEQFLELRSFHIRVNAVDLFHSEKRAGQELTIDEAQRRVGAKFDAYDRKVQEELLRPYTKDVYAMED